MRLTKTSLALSLPLFALPCHAELFPNGNFEEGGASWQEVSGSGTFSFDYPATGGNDNGYGVIDHTAADGGFGIWVGNADQPITLAELNLEAGSTYNFTQDMILLSGPNIGGFKLDFTNGGVNAGSTGDLRQDLIGDGSTWETYTFQIPIPEGVDGFKIVPLWGIDSSVGFDNIGFDPTPVLPPVEPPVVEPSTEPMFATGTLVSWTPTEELKAYQPQSSEDGTTWTDFGPSFLGIETTTVLDPGSAAFYRVQEKEPVGDGLLFNGDFEIASSTNPTCPEGWECNASAGQFATQNTTDAFTGQASARLAVFNGDSPAPNSASLKNTTGNVTAGETYTLSFWSKQISSGVTYVQGYKVLWFSEPGGAGAVLGTSEAPFGGEIGTWEKVTISNLTPPTNAVSIGIEFTGATGALAGDDVKGEVLLDNVSLTLGGSTPPVNLDATTAEGVGVVMLTKSGVLYKAQESEDLSDYQDLTGTFFGNGQVMGAGIPDGGLSHFFRILEIPQVPVEGN